jgi:hypothetical protein
VPPCSGETGVAGAIEGTVEVQARVAIHDQTSRVTDEIADERPQRDLLGEVGAELTASQALPQAMLGNGGIGGCAARKIVGSHDAQFSIGRSRWRGCDRRGPIAGWRSRA